MKNKISIIIESNEFKNILKEAIKKGVYEDYGYDHDNENEYTFDNFDEDVATNAVIKILKEHLTQNPKQ